MQAGDVLGVVDGDVAFIDTEIAGSARGCSRACCRPGASSSPSSWAPTPSPALGNRARALERDRPEVEVVVIDGGQPVYPLLVGVE